jgi:hypothetical protein
MESANEKKGHWMLIDLKKVIDAIDIETLDIKNLELLKEILNQYEQDLKLQEEYSIRIEKHIKTQKKITLGFFIGFILLESFMIYNSSNPLEPVSIILLILMILTAGYISQLQPSPQRK